VIYKDSKSQTPKLDFPKGKQNQSENELACAIREVREEIGIDVSKQIREDEYVIVETMPGKKVKLFLIQNVDDTIPLRA